MTHRALVRWGGAGVATASLCLGLPLLAASGPASAQTASPSPGCAIAPSSSASPSATPTATTSPTSGGGLPGPISTIISTLSPRPSSTPTSTTGPGCVSPSASATSTATTSPSATSTATATPTATAGGTACPSPLTVSIDRAFTIPGVAARVTVNAPVGADIELQAYSRPTTTYAQVRRTTAASTSTTFDILPGTNTRLFARCVGQASSESVSRVLNVRTALSLTVVRNGRRDYTFQGRILPRRADQLITLYRVTSSGERVLTKQIKTDASGTYRINRVFTGSGRFGFLTRTGQTLTNAAGESNGGRARPTDVF